jgi:1-acylglycerone phosphate reductase
MAPLKFVLITGCSDGGIGSALATVFHERGYHVVATARDVSKMSALAGLQNTTLLALDVAGLEQITAAVEAVRNETGGTLDVLINNAGRNHFSPVLDIDIAAAKNVYETNLWGPLAMIQAFAPLLIKAKGTIVSITSISGYVNVPHMGKLAN